MQTQELGKVKLQFKLVWLVVILLYIAWGFTAHIVDKRIAALETLIQAQQKTIKTQADVNANLVLSVQSLTRINKQQLERVLELRDEPFDRADASVSRDKIAAGRGGVSGNR